MSVYQTAWFKYTQGLTKRQLLKPSVTASQSRDSSEEEINSWRQIDVSLGALGGFTALCI